MLILYYDCRIEATGLPCLDIAMREYMHLTSKQTLMLSFLLIWTLHWIQQVHPDVLSTLLEVGISVFISKELKCSKIPCNGFGPNVSYLEQRGTNFYGE